MLYRLFTENKNYEQMKKLVGKFFDGFTIIKTNGVWQGESEHSLIIEIVVNEKSEICDIDYEPDIKQLCYVIKKLNEQDKILVQRIESDSRLV